MYQFLMKGRQAGSKQAVRRHHLLYRVAWIRAIVAQVTTRQ
jgi:hypothetical protein